MSPMHPFLEMIRQRTSVETFDTRPVDDEMIRALVEDAARTPSSFNIQHWRFVAVRNDEDKERLCRAAFGQEQVRDAAVTFIVLGDLFRFLGVDDTFQPNVEVAHNVSYRPRNDALHGVYKPSGLRRLLLPILPERAKPPARRMYDLNRAPPQQLSPELRARLLACYRPEIERIEELIERDLSSWLDDERPARQNDAADSLPAADSVASVDSVDGID